MARIPKAPNLAKVKSAMAKSKPKNFLGRALATAKQVKGKPKKR